MTYRSPRRAATLIWQSGALIALLASTWLIVGVSLNDASASTVAAGRTGFTVLGLMAVSCWSKARNRAATLTAAPATGAGKVRHRWWQTMTLALTGVSAYTALSTAAISLAGPEVPALLLSLTPVVVLAAEGIHTRTRPPGRTVVGTTIAVAGAALFVTHELGGALGRNTALGSLAALGALLSMAFYSLYFAHTHRDHSGPMARHILPIFTVGAIPLAGWAGPEIMAGGAVGWTTTGVLALLGTAVYVPAYLLQHRILAVAGASYSSLIQLAVPPLVALTSTASGLTAAPAPVQIIGMALTSTGMYIFIRSKLTSSPQTTNRIPSGHGRSDTGCGPGDRFDHDDRNS
ncbi:DMT family transporter [Streptomyces rubiginosohelvolus]|uniref:DMT family transporter n=1 Tax=Streptomyces rubiginosohelvolus TaxID=67362 RepID=UPI00343AED75